MIPMYSDELSHHGIKGQKWGKRNGPPYPLDYNARSVSEKNSFQKSHHDKLVNQYKKHNEKLSDDEIEKILKRNFKLAKNFLIAGGVLALGAGTYYACISANNVNLNNDYVLKAGNKIFRVAQSDSSNLHDNFYASFNKKDADWYAGLANNGTFGTDKNLKTYINKKDIKIAGVNTLEKKYASFTKNLNLKDKQFLDEQGLLNSNSKINGHDSGFMTFFQKAPMAEESAKYFNDKSYASFEKESKQLSSIFEEFKNELKKDGYGGIVDTNDFCGFFSDSTKTPVIYFNGDDFSFKSVKPINQKFSAAKYYIAEKGEEVANKLIIGIGAASVGSIIAGTSLLTLGSNYVNKGKISNSKKKEEK